MSASGAYTRVSAKKETTFGVFAGASGAQILRRTSCDLDTDADNFGSAEIRADQQTSTNRQGMRKIGGTLNGELSPGSYADFFASMLRRDFAVGATTGSVATISSTATTLHRSAGSFLTNGFKVGDVIAAAGFVATANNGPRLLIAAMTATDLTLLNIDGTTPTLTVEAAGANITVAVVGKKTFTPQTGHTKDSYSIERFYPDLDVPSSSMFVGCRVGSVDVNLPPTGYATVAIAFMGRDSIESDAGEQFTAPDEASDSDGLTAVSGALLIDGALVGNVTGVQFKADGSPSTVAVVGDKRTPDVWLGRVSVTGQFTAIFDDASYRSKFRDEVEIGMVCLLTDGSGATGEFVAFNMSRIKLNGAKVDDKETGGLIVTCPFTALLATAGGAAVSAEKTTLVIQDSLA